MFWRVELTKKGKLKSCKEVADKGKGDNYVIFIEAATRDGAVAESRIWWRLQRAKERREMIQYKRKHNLCGKCVGVGRPAVPGYRLCKVHLQSFQASVRESRRLMSKPPKIREAEMQKVSTETLKFILFKFKRLGAIYFRQWLTAEIAKRAGLSIVKKAS